MLFTESVIEVAFATISKRFIQYNDCYHGCCWCCLQLKRFICRFYTVLTANWVLPTAYDTLLIHMGGETLVETFSPYTLTTSIFTANKRCFIARSKNIWSNPIFSILTVSYSGCCMKIQFGLKHRNNRMVRIFCLET